MKIKQNRSEASDKSSLLLYGRQWIDEDDIQAVVDVLHSGRITQGPKIEEFEQALAKYCGARYAVVVNSGTAALHIACLAAGLKPGDKVITSPITFLASANCVLYCGGKPVFADIKKESYNINPDEVKRVIISKTRAVIPVHFAGFPCDMEKIKKIADNHGLIVIEDACHALSAEWEDSDGRWHKVGSCSHSDMTVFSFHPVKHITTGEGGAILTNKSELYEKLLLLRNHGITKDPDKFINKDMAFSSDSFPNPWYYEMQELGFNFRITDMQCALGLFQLKRLDYFTGRRREIARMYSEAFRGIKYIKIPVEKRSQKSAYHIYVLEIDFDSLGKSRSSFMKELRNKGIGTQVHYIPVHTQPYYQSKFHTKWGDCPNAEQYYQKCLSIPLFPSMSDPDIKRVIHEIKGIIK